MGLFDAFKGKKSANAEPSAPVQELTAYISGRAIPIEEVNDPVFASKSLGDGMAIRPEGQTVTAPCDGEISMAAETGHAIGIAVNNGAELLLHIGIDTVSLNGEGFQLLVKEGSRVRQGDPLLKFDKALVEKNGFSTDCILIVTNPEDFPDLKFLCGADVRQNETLIGTFYTRVH